jgi:hypothetical protein
VLVVLLVQFAPAPPTPPGHLSTFSHNDTDSSGIRWTAERLVSIQLAACMPNETIGKMYRASQVNNSYFFHHLPDASSLQW